MPLYSWNSGDPGEPAPYSPAGAFDADGVEITGMVSALNTDTGEVTELVMGPDGDFKINIFLGQVERRTYFRKPPLTVVPKTPDAEECDAPVVLGD